MHTDMHESTCGRVRERERSSKSGTMISYRTISLTYRYPQDIYQFILIDITFLDLLFAKVDISENKIPVQEASMNSLCGDMRFGVVLLSSSLPNLKILYVMACFRPS